MRTDMTKGARFKIDALLGVNTNLPKTGDLHTVSDLLTVYHHLRHGDNCLSGRLGVPYIIRGHLLFQSASRTRNATGEMGIVDFTPTPLMSIQPSILSSFRLKRLELWPCVSSPLAPPSARVMNSPRIHPNRRPPAFGTFCPTKGEREIFKLESDFLCPAQRVNASCKPPSTVITWPVVLLSRLVTRRKYASA